MEVSVKVTSIVRCKFTSLESCRMSGCDNKQRVNKSTEPCAKCRERKHKSSPYLELLEEFTAKPQDVFDLFDPEECEVLGECQ